jgi:signal transduction histidine kinase
VEIDWRAGPVRVRADRGRLAQALGNLLANAVEHGAGPIRVSAWRSGERVRLEVVNRADRGRGLRIASRAVEQSGGTLAVAAIELPLAS